MNLQYLLLELKRTVRNPRFLMFAVGFPVVYFLLFSTLIAKGEHADQIVPALMVGMAGFGAVSSSVSTGTRIALERGSGWQRQLRLTPLSGFSYLSAKVLTGMLVSAVPLLLVYLMGALVKDVHLSAGTWVELFLVSWISVLPLAMIGVFLGQVVSPTSVQAVAPATLMLLSLLGGLWFQVDDPAWLLTVAKALPSYWLGEFGRTVAFGGDFAQRGVVVLVAWTVILGLAVMRRFRAATARV
ncbi:ABC transporter permease [Pseudonocardiaceae bacterium YIM PH 21723]|nr:ABC transporter permease [Pseudonocardiaceae bacterium YIM PH 21723]